MDLNISPCPNDTFIFGPLILGKIKDFPYTLNVTFSDVQTLNESVLRGAEGLSKISFGVLSELAKEYKLLKSGGAMGYGCGPLLLSRNETLKDAPVFLPGQNTTASFLYKYWAKQTDASHSIKYGLFDELYRQMLSGSIDNAVLIHECRFVYQKDGLHLIEDLGAFWEKYTKSPIPLGCIVYKGDKVEDWEYWIKKSIEYARANTEEIMPFIREHAQFPEESVMLQHIETYVNDFSYDFGAEGQKAIDTLLALQKS